MLRFNKPQAEFTHDEDWFNYQELIEDHSELSLSDYSAASLSALAISVLFDVWNAVFSLVEGQNVQQTEAAIEEYRKANYDSIVANDAKKVSFACYGAPST